LIQTGNPLFPFLNELFKSPYWPPDQTQTVLKDMQAAGIHVTWRNWWAIFTIFWDIAADQTDSFRGNIGPFYVMLVPLLLFRRPTPAVIQWILAFSFCYWLFWIFTGQHLRY